MSNPLLPASVILQPSAPAPPAFLRPPLAAGIQHSRCYLTSGSCPAFPARRLWTAAVAATAGVEGSVDDVEVAPSSIELLPLASEEQFDGALAEAQQQDKPLVVLWMASWCRKCIYLKPKLEKLAADYHPRIRFYSVDVNIVPQRLVNRAGITKMPTIQLWKDSQKLSEVIGGHKAWLVVEEVRRMIESDY